MSDTLLAIAWNALGDELDELVTDSVDHPSTTPQLQEALDLVTVWEWIKEKCGGLFHDGIRLYIDGGASHEHIEFSQLKDGSGWLHKAGEWVRQQGERDE